MGVVERAALPAALIAHLESEYPQEGCGLLLEDSQTATLHLHRMRNDYQAHHQAQPHRYPHTARTAFAFHPGDWLRVLLRAEAQGLRIACVYHSHTDTSAHFSQEDAEWAAPGGQQLLPGTSYLVVAVVAGRVTHARCYGWTGGGFSELAGFP